MTSPKDYSPWVPFDLYDFFGYLFPGAFLLFTTCLFFQFSGLFNFIDVINDNIKVYEKAPFIVGLIMVVMGIILVYTLGHFVAMFGQIIFDRIFLDEIIQHPIFTLLNIQKGEREYSIAIFQSLFILYNFLLLINILNININASVFGSEYQLLDLVILVIMITLIVIKVGVMVYRFKPENREKLVKRGLPKWIEKPTLFFKRKIFNMFNSSFKKLLGLDRPFPDEFIQKHKINFKNYFGLNSDEMGYENY